MHNIIPTASEKLSVISFKKKNKHIKKDLFEKLFKLLEKSPDKKADMPFNAELKKEADKKLFFPKKESRISEKKNSEQKTVERFFSHDIHTNTEVFHIKHTEKKYKIKFHIEKRIDLKKNEKDLKNIFSKEEHLKEKNISVPVNRDNKQEVKNIKRKINLSLKDTRDIENNHSVDYKEKKVPNKKLSDIVKKEKNLSNNEKSIHISIKTEKRSYNIKEKPVNRFEKKAIEGTDKHTIDIFKNSYSYRYIKTVPKEKESKKETINKEIPVKREKFSVNFDNFEKNEIFPLKNIKKESIKQGKYTKENQQNINVTDNSKISLNIYQFEPKIEKIDVHKKEKVDGYVDSLDKKENPNTEEKIKKEVKVISGSKSIKFRAFQKKSDEIEITKSIKKNEKHLKDKQIKETSDNEFIFIGETQDYKISDFKKEEKILKPEENIKHITSEKHSISDLDSLNSLEGNKDNFQDSSFDQSYTESKGQENRKTHISNFNRVFTLTVNFNSTNITAKLAGNRLNLTVILSGSSINYINSLKTDIANILKEQGFNQFNLKIQAKGKKIYYSNNYSKEEKREINVKV